MMLHMLAIVFAAGKQRKSAPGIIIVLHAKYS